MTMIRKFRYVPARNKTTSGRQIMGEPAMSSNNYNTVMRKKWLSKHEEIHQVVQWNINMNKCNPSSTG